MSHEYFMHQCIKLAKKGRELVGPNPLVGSVLVRDGTVIAEGAYMGKGTHHAERSLLESFDGDISSEDILYVNLEPCCHQGNTPPCTDSIIEYGIQTVVVGMKDPDTRVAGQGTKALRGAGVNVVGPVLQERCRRFNKGFVSLRENNRPYITIKRAQTKQGITTSTDGTRLCITSDAQNMWSHTYLRATHDAILVGVQTVIADNPELTIRNGEWEMENGKCQPWRIILDPALRIPFDAKVLGEKCILIKELKNSQETKEKMLQQKGVTIIHIPMNNNHFDWNTLFNALSAAHSPFFISSILVEGGEKTWGAFKRAGMVDEEVVLVE